MSLTRLCHPPLKIPPESPDKESPFPLIHDSSTPKRQTRPGQSRDRGSPAGGGELRDGGGSQSYTNCSFLDRSRRPREAIHPSQTCSYNDNDDNDDNDANDDNDDYDDTDQSFFYAHDNDIFWSDPLPGHGFSPTIKQIYWFF